MTKFQLSRAPLILFCASTLCLSAYASFKYYRKRKLLNKDFIKGEVKNINSKSMSNLKTIFVSGLKGCGKSSLVHRLNIEYGQDEFGLRLIPSHNNVYGITILRNIPTINFGYCIWEVADTACHTLFWTQHLRQRDVKLIMFVVDSSDKEKLPQAALLFKQLLGDSRIPKLPILIVATKQDCLNALKPEQIKEILDLSNITRHETMQTIEVIGCEAGPPDLSDRSKTTWTYDSMKEVMKKIIFLTSTVL